MLPFLVTKQLENLRALTISSGAPRGMSVPQSWSPNMPNNGLGYKALVTST